METLKKSQEIKIGKGFRELLGDEIIRKLFSEDLITQLKFIQTNGIKRFERKTKRRRRKSTSSKRVRFLAAVL